METGTDLNTLAIRADDEGPAAGHNGHARSIMCDVMGVCLALVVECVVR